MAKRSYRASSAQMRRLLASPGVRRVLRQVAQRRAVPAFRAAAPRDTGAYARDVSVVDATGWDGRAAVRIVAHRRKGGAVSIEFGTSDTPAAHALQHTINAIQRRR